jgi:hypothetical protein
MRSILSIVLILFLLQTLTAQHTDSNAFYKLKDSLEFYKDMHSQLKSDQLERDTIEGLEIELSAVKKKTALIEGEILKTLNKQDKRILPFIHTALAAELQLPKDLNPKTPILDVRRASFLATVTEDTDQREARSAYRYLVLCDSLEHVLYNRFADCDLVLDLVNSSDVGWDGGYNDSQYADFDSKLETFKTAMSKLCKEFEDRKISQKSFNNSGYKGVMTFDKVKTYGINPFMDGDQCQCK